MTAPRDVAPLVARRRAVAALVVLASAVAGCSSEPTPAEASASRVCEQLQSTFDENEEALALVVGSLVVVQGYDDAPASVDEREYDEALNRRCPDLMEQVGSFDAEKAVDDMLEEIESSES